MADVHLVLCVLVGAGLEQQPRALGLALRRRTNQRRASDLRMLVINTPRPMVCAHGKMWEIGQRCEDIRILKIVTWLCIDKQFEIMDSTLNKITTKNGYYL